MITKIDKFMERNVAWYRGYQMIKDLTLSPGAKGYWFIPELSYRKYGNKIEKGYLTVSMTQGREAIDEWFDFNQKISDYK